METRPKPQQRGETFRLGPLIKGPGHRQGMTVAGRCDLRLGFSRTLCAAVVALFFAGCLSVPSTPRPHDQPTGGSSSDVPSFLDPQNTQASAATETTTLLTIRLKYSTNRDANFDVPSNVSAVIVYVNATTSTSTHEPEWVIADDPQASSSDDRPSGVTMTHASERIRIALPPTQGGNPSPTRIYSEVRTITPAPSGEWHLHLAGTGIHMNFDVEVVAQHRR